MCTDNLDSRDGTRPDSGKNKIKNHYRDDPRPHAEIPLQLLGMWHFPSCWGSDGSILPPPGIKVTNSQWNQQSQVLQTIQRI
jgi:hypothetical protein